MAIIRVDGESYQVPEDKDLLSALIGLGVEVPYFCWHPALGSVGACRQCAVKVYQDESDEKGRIVMACMTPVRDDMRLSVKDPEVTAFRQRVIEWLMIAHPHDCPVCDEGGECHLQDMTVLTGHVYRRYRGRKRTFQNQDLGPFINHEMNRCIQCYRCLRFYRDYAGGRDFDAFAAKDFVYFGRHEDGALESEFSGNLIEICPTGVFTDNTLKRHYTRKWDLETAPSICVHCGLGCNIIPGARDGVLRRIQGRFHPEVNQYFICDRGRFGYEFVNHPARRRRAEARRSPPEASISWAEAMQQAHASLQSCRRVLGVGSPRASLEANCALRALVGADAFSPGMSAVEHAGMTQALTIFRAGLARSPSLAEVESADAVFILGADPTNEAPMLDLAIRQGMHRARLDISRSLGIPDWDDYPVRNALQNERGKLYIAAPAGMKLDAIAVESWRAAPPELVALGVEVAKAVGQGQAPAQRGNASHHNLAERIAQALTEARRSLVVVSANGGLELLSAAGMVANVVSVTTDSPCLLSIIAPECNSMGAAMLGGRNLDDLLEEIESGVADGLIVLENDLFRRASPRRIERALHKLRHLIVLDYLPTRTTDAAELVLPVTTFAETTGTFVSSEGRAQRSYRVFLPEGEPRPSWQVLGDLHQARRPEAPVWSNLEEVLRAMAKVYPDLAPVIAAAPPASWRNPLGQQIARAPHRYSGRAAKDADRAIVEPQTPLDPETPFAFSMEGAQHGLPAALTPRYWRPGWNSVQALHYCQPCPGRSPLVSAPGERLLETVTGGLKPEKGMPTTSSEPEIDPCLSPGEVWVVPRAVIFGSDELSRLAPAVASLMPPATIRLHPEEAAKSGIAHHDLVRLVVRDREYLLPARLDPQVAPGVAVVPAAFPETEGLLGVSRARMEKVT